MGLYKRLDFPSSPDSPDEGFAIVGSGRWPGLRDLGAMEHAHYDRRVGEKRVVERKVACNGYAVMRKPGQSPTWRGTDSDRQHARMRLRPMARNAGHNGMSCESRQVPVHYQAPTIPRGTVAATIGLQMVE